MARRLTRAMPASNAPATRLSTPFFLYPDDGAVLDSTLLRSDLCFSRPLPSPAPPTLPVAHFKANRANCRGTWPWKATRYYRGLVMGRDSDPFPGGAPPSGLSSEDEVDEAG